MEHDRTLEGEIFSRRIPPPPMLESDPLQSEKRHPLTIPYDTPPSQLVPVTLLDAINIAPPSAAVHELTFEFFTPIH